MLVCSNTETVKIMQDNGSNIILTRIRPIKIIIKSPKKILL